MNRRPGGGQSLREESESRTMSTGTPGILRDREQTDTVETENVTPRRLNTDIPLILPHERVFPIQIGSELFRLSGASISSDGKHLIHPNHQQYEMKASMVCIEIQADRPRAPSYFSQFFQCQLKEAEDQDRDTNAIRTLYIDRDPVTFGDISLHLQGYHVSPRNSSHFVKLFADAQFYSCMLPSPCLNKKLIRKSAKVNIPTL
jgi:hypothetical protein